MRCEGRLRVGASVGHGQQERLAVLELEVLIGELLAVDGAATSALGYVLSLVLLQRRGRRRVNVRYRG